MSATLEPVPESSGGLSRRRRLLVLGICCMSLLVVGLDATIVNVALPAIHRSFDSSLPGLQWTVDAYTLVLASLLVLAGSTADRVGRKLIFRIGLVLFTLGSAFCAGAPTLGLLIAARVVQAVGGSMLNPVALSIVRDVFKDPRERAVALGIWTATFGVSMALGPLLGGALVDGPGWRFVFLVNLPIGIIALVLMTIFVPDSRADRPRRLDPIGQGLVIIALFSLVYAIIEGGDHGWDSPGIVTLFGTSVLAFALLIPYELHRREPLIEVRLFTSAPFSGASAVAVLAFASLTGFLLLNTLYLQEARGFSALHAGLATLPVAVMVVVIGPISGRIIGTRGTRVPLVAGGLAMSVGALMLTGINDHTSAPALFVAYLIFGIGMAAVNPPITITALEGLPPSQAGVAAALASTSRQVGGTLGIAVIGAAVGAGGRNVFGPGFAEATHIGWWIIAGLAVTVLAIGIVTTTNWAHGTARRTAARIAAPADPAA